MDPTFIIPAPARSGEWEELGSVPLELARSRRVQGRVFEKHILNEGILIHPKTGERIKVDGAFTDALLANFERGVCDIVQVPVANDRNEHVEAPAANIGEVIGLRKDSGKVYALIDARDPGAADKLGKTYLGASAFLSTDYTDTSTGRKAGPTLLHVAVTNRPYVTGLDDYKEVVAATRTIGASDTADNEPVVLTAEETVPTREELIAALRDEYGVDVEGLQLAASQADGAAALTQALTTALSGVPAGVGLAGRGEDQITADDIVGAVVELSRQNAVIAQGYQDLRRERAADQVDALIGTGHILPKQRDFAVELKLSGSPEQWDQFLPAEPIVPVDTQIGFSGDGSAEVQQTKAQEDEVLRLTAAYSQYFKPPATAGSTNGHGGR